MIKIALMYKGERVEHNTVTSILMTAGILFVNTLERDVFGDSFKNEYQYKLESVEAFNIHK